MKQKGSVIDTSSERSITKVWDGLALLSFCFDDKKIEYKLTQAVAEDDKGKGGKKDAKKDAKKPPAPPAKGKNDKGAVDAPTEDNPDNTKVIKSFKTYRQKSAASWRHKLYDEAKKKFDARIVSIKDFFQGIENDEYKFEFKWEQNVQSLNNL